MRATVDFHSPAGLQLPQALERELYYLTVEALNNTLKHARATEVSVLVRMGPSEVTLEVLDDGCGFRPLETSGGHGLRNMRERVERMGGRLEIASTPGAGTRITAWVGLATG